jgi:hypothetical protein
MWDEEDNKCDLEPRKNDEVEPNVAIFPLLHIALMLTVVKEVHLEPYSRPSPQDPARPSFESVHDADTRVHSRVRPSY